MPPSHAQSIPRSLLALKGGFANLPQRPQPSHLLLLACEDADELRAKTLALRARLAETEDLRSIAALFERAAAPRAGRHRLAVVGASARDLVDRLDLALQKLAQPLRERFQAKGAVFYGEVSDDTSGRDGAGRTGRTVFLFPGQGSQVEGMLDELCLVFPSVRAWIEDLDRALSDLPVVAPSVLAYPPVRELTGEGLSALAHERIELASGAQLGVVVNLALCDLLTDLGVEPDLIAGHSNGEHAAIYASGIVALDRGGVLGLCRRFSEIALSMPPPASAEAVAAVSLVDRKTLDDVIGRHDALFLSMINCPTQFVIAGTADAVRDGSAALRAAGALVQAMPFRRAYHTSLFSTWSERLSAVYSGNDIVEPRVPLYSCVTAEPFPSDAAGFHRCAADQLSCRLDFQATLERLYTDGGRRFVEVGPGNALTGFVNDTLRDRAYLAVTTARAGQPALPEFQRALARLFVDGVDLDYSSRTWRTLEESGWAAVVGAHGARAAGSRADAQPPAPPQAPAQQAAFPAEIARRHFDVMNEFLASQSRMLDLVLAATAREPLPAPSSPWPLLGTIIDRRPSRIETRRRYTVEHDPLLGEHSLGPHLPGGPRNAAPLAVVPFTFSMEIAAEAALELFAGGVVARMRGIRGSRWLALDRGVLDLAIEAEVRSAAPSVAAVRLFDLAEGRRALAFEAEVEVTAGFAVQAGRFLPPPSAPSRPATWAPARFYRDFAFHGPAFQSIRSIDGVDAERIAARLEIPRPPGGDARPCHLDPGFLDSAGQLVGLWLLEHGNEHFGIFPFQLRSFEHVRLAPAPGTIVRAEARVRRPAPGVTSADIEFFDEAGAFYRLSGFEQRYLPLPASLVTTLMGGWSADPHVVPPRQRFLSVEGASPSERVIALPHKLLEESWGIWRRALAHHVLSRRELDDWYDAERRDTAWLLGRAAAKEAVRRSIEARGLRVESVDLSVTGPAAGVLTVDGAALDAAVSVAVERVGDATLARLGRGSGRIGNAVSPTLAEAGT
jgi:malonyl CoA-acyl carrier protein transacylase